MTRAKNKIFPEITLDINGLSHDGRGIATHAGKTLFIHGAMPGEKVLAKITKQHRRYSEGKVLEVLTASHDRVAPLCSHYGICGGCSLQHMNMQSQIQFKQQTLINQLQHFGHVSAETILPPLSGQPWGYRGKARLGVRYVIKKEKLLVGFREKLSNYLADIDSCAVLHPSIGPHINALAELVASLTQFEHIAQIEVAVGDHATALVFRHLNDLTDEDIEKLISFGAAHQFHIYLQPNPPKVLHKIWPTDSIERLHYLLSDYQLEMQFHPLDFTQVNSETNQLMIQQALTLLDVQATDNVLDLFCGLGNFTLPMAKTAKHVTGIEGSQTMVERGYENAKHNEINNVDFYAANLFEPDLQWPWLQKQYDKILLDPPRTGAEAILPFLTKMNAKKIVYVSCNPATLARDAGIFVNTFGFKLKKVGVINMFPHTSHIEAIALFER